ncbi:hypothetical protein EPA93_43655 [Ktedonosporobacter rubrisoli]|uniref:Uncharacterized protein n=1 Tax=Ktedonosporobacter rubrisoli TaxID=2509675 RepID=A0A4P6K2Y1_KTERU|nr:hypothetical protein [Ktedonosporobacter rubrisoli]QBD82504.1 hypothetical protein EPA93_43655 [Ktedonosporobacter rubrisoli]
MSEFSSKTEDTKFQQLISLGFSEAEAINLMRMKEHINEEIEYREILEESRRLSFIRWLIEHDRMSR